MKRFAFLLGLVVAVASVCVAQDMAELEVDHNVNSEFVTPHTAWATPYTLGKTRVLFFVNGRGTNAREVIELKQRFDFDPQMIFWGRIVDTTKDDWHGGENGLRRIARLLAEKWDAYVFIDIVPEKLPVEQQYPLVKAVTAGAGLVVIGSDDKRLLKDKNQLPALPAFLADVDGATAFTVKQGRGVRLAKRPTIDYRPGWEVTYDEWAMRVGKAILWAAGKEPKLSLTLTPKAKELPRPSLPGVAATLTWQGAPAGTTAEVGLRDDSGCHILLDREVRELNGRKRTALRDLKLPLDKPEGTADITIPEVLCAGNYYLDVVARDGVREGCIVVGFASVPFAVTSERKIEDIKLVQDWAEIGQRLKGQVVLSGPPGADEDLAISLSDRRGRMVALQEVKPVGAETAFEFEVQQWFPMLLEVRACLSERSKKVATDYEPVARAWKYARVVKRHRGQFNFVMWDLPRGNLAPVAEESLARNSVTVQLCGGTPPPYIAAYDVAWIPYTTHIDGKKDDKGVMTPACWNDEAGIQAHVDKIVESYVPSRQHGVFVYSLGDEIAVRGSCLSPQCIEAYRKYLQEQYKDIATLNASWGSTYAGFADVQLSKPDDNDETEAFRAGNFPRWFDRQAFQSYTFCKLCERFGKGFRRIDPESRCGFEGAGTFGHADDLDGFVRYNTFWSPYPGTADEVLRSIAPRDFPRANWMGYTKDADTLLEKYWRMVTRGCDSVWWWRWEVVGRFHGWLAPSMDPYPAVKEILQDTQIVRAGLGDLLLNSEMQTDGIGILYSQPSAYAAKVQASPSYGSYESNHAAFHQLLRELGLNFRYFSDRQVRLGEVDLSKFKVILLPMTQALSAQEAEMFRQYVRNGGLLIADIRPAIYDGHVKPLAAGQLDDVFGIKRTGADKALEAGGTITVPAPAAGGEPETLNLAKAPADGGVQAAGAVAAGAAGQAPLFLTNTFGQGRAVLLNLAVSALPALGADTTPESAARLWRQILGQGQVTPALEISDAQGRRLRIVEVTRWMNGPVQIVSIFRHQGTPAPVRVSLPQALHVYDLKNRRDLGRMQTFELTLTPYRAMFFALSPEPLAPVTVEAAPTVAPGSVQRVRITSALPQGQQAVHVQVKLPDGRMADWVDPVALADAKGVTVDVPVAFNDQSGTWTVNATDLYTGKTTSASFRVGR